MPNEDELNKVRAQVTSTPKTVGPPPVAQACVDIGGRGKLATFTSSADTEQEARRAALKLARSWLDQAQEAVSEALALEYQYEPVTDDDIRAFGQKESTLGLVTIPRLCAEALAGDVNKRAICEEMIRDQRESEG
jgi:hypothetical protein